MLKIKFVDMPSGALREKTLPLLHKHFGEVIECDSPDFLFYSVFGYEHLKYDCVRIQWIGENLRPDFNICDYAIGFDHMEFRDRYCRIPLYFFYVNDYEKAINKHMFYCNQDISLKKFCNFVYSNADASLERTVFFKLLSAYKHVDSGGKYMNNIGKPVEDKYEFQREYKFSIAFENSSTDGYTTEKILQAFAAGTIPIYWGNPAVGEDFNEKSFINCHSYASFEDVVNRVIEIDVNDSLYYQYMREPIGSKEQFPQDPLGKYEEFLVYICSQSPMEAIRRSNIMYGKQYQQEQREFRFATERDERKCSVIGRGLKRIRDRMMK
ncbi:MAG: glycosyltransferase family 10 [Blautia sp.]|nr:glycosyltransferase family 10 [Blautia sp.]